MEEKFNFGKIRDNFNRIKTELPRVMANQAQNFFLDSFQRQGWDDNGSQPWPEVKRRQEGTPEYKYPKGKGLSRRTSPILVRTGTLKRAVGNSIKYVSFDTTVLKVPLAYAAAQNDGNPSRNLVQRRFMGNSTTLFRMQREKINQFIDKIWTT